MLRHMPPVPENAVLPERHVKLFKNGRNQAVRIPREFEKLRAMAIDPYLGIWQYAVMIGDLEVGFKALASDKRLQILAWLKDPTAHFRPQIDGDLVKDGVCGQLITEKLGVSQPTASEHLRILVDAGFLTGKRLKQWVFFRRDEPAIAAFLKAARIEV